MDEKEFAEHAKDTLGIDQDRYDDPAEAMKWTDHTHEQEERMRDAYNYSKAFIQKLGAEITEPQSGRLVVRLNTGCNTHNGMCVGLNPNTLKVYQTADDPTIMFEGNQYDLDKGIGVICEKISNQNQNVVRIDKDSNYKAFYHLKILN